MHSPVHTKFTPSNQNPVSHAESHLAASFTVHPLVQPSAHSEVNISVNTLFYVCFLHHGEPPVANMYTTPGSYPHYMEVS